MEMTMAMENTATGLDVGLFLKMFGDVEAWSGISASGAGPAAACPTRMALPRAFTTSDAAERGTELHAFARVVTLNPDCRAQALLDVPDKYRHTAEGMDIGAALEGLEVVRCEPAYALDVKAMKVRYIGENIERAYNETLIASGQPPLGRYEIPLSIDVEATLDATPVECDYKSGQNIGDVADHVQRQLCATALMLFHDSPSAISRVLYIWEDGRIIQEGHEFSIFDADDFCAKMVHAIDAVYEARLLIANGIMPSVNPGDDQCKFCPSVRSCPYWTNYAKSMLGRLQEIEKGPELSTLSHEEIARVWEEAKQAAKIAEGIIDGLKTMVAQEAVVIDEKSELRQEWKSKSFFDAGKARGLIVQLLGRAGATEEEIEAKMKELQGTNEYPEIRKRKRLLAVAA